MIFEGFAGLLRGPFWDLFWVPKVFEKSMQIQADFRMVFWSKKGAQRDPEIQGKWNRVRVKFSSHFWTSFGYILELFWAPFGLQFSVRKRIENHIKKTMLKNLEVSKCSPQGRLNFAYALGL